MDDRYRSPDPNRSPAGVRWGALLLMAGLLSTILMTQLRGFVAVGGGLLTAALVVAAVGLLLTVSARRRASKPDGADRVVPSRLVVAPPTGPAVVLVLAACAAMVAVMTLGVSWWSAVRMGRSVAHSEIQRVLVTPHSRGPSDVEVSFMAGGEQVRTYLADPEQDDSFYAPGIDVVYVPSHPTHAMAFADYKSARESWRGWLLLGLLLACGALAVWVRSSIRRRRELLGDGRPTVAPARLRYKVSSRGPDVVRIEWADGVKGAYVANDAARSLLGDMVTRWPGAEVDALSRGFLAEGDEPDDQDEAESQKPSDASSDSGHLAGPEGRDS